MKLSFRNTFYALATLIAIIFIMQAARTLLVPITFALLIAFILYPICVWLEKKGVNRLWSILWTMIGVTLILLGITFLFSTQIIDIVKELDDFSDRLNEVLLAVTTFLNENVSVIPTINKDSLIDLGLEWASSKSGGMLSNTLNNTALLFTGITLTLIYSFLILLYRKGFKQAFISFAPEGKKDQYAEMISKIQQVGQKYLTGMFILIIILGLLDTLGLFLIGIDYPLFFGFLAAFLAIVPYVGTTLGGAIPAIYAFMNYDSYWYPVGVILVFWFIQILEGNILNPKIVGGNLNINALASIIVLIGGGLLWGIPGMILFLPLTAVFRVVCEYFDDLRPIGLFIEDNVSRQDKSLSHKFKKILTKK